MSEEMNERIAQYKQVQERERRMMRFTAACAAMQGIMSSTAKYVVGPDDGNDNDKIAMAAISVADVLLARLKESEK